MGVCGWWEHGVQYAGYDAKICRGRHNGVPRDARDVLAMTILATPFQAWHE
jgi:hypothetical protein